jgi:hypothetical protein
MVTRPPSNLLKSIKFTTQKEKMHLKKSFLCVAGCLFAATTIGALLTPKLSAAIKAAFVEVVMPSKPFFAFLVSSSSAIPQGAGPGEGTLGVTNITVSNSGSEVNGVQIFQPVTDNCSNPTTRNIEGGPLFLVFVQPQQTVTLPFPTPLVFAQTGGRSCIAVAATISSSNMLVSVTGFVN